MTIFEAVILGAVQGLTEFLPVSSSGHLVLMQKLFGITEPVLLFDTMLHFGTLIAVCAVLQQDIRRLLRRPIQRLTGFLILATLPAVIIGLLFKDTIEDAFASAAYLGYAFLFTGVLLLISDSIARSSRKMKNEYTMHWTDAAVIGLFQGIAVIPGVSRSGSTLSGALFRGLSRDFGGRFSFLLSIPVILGALVLQAKDLVQEGTALEISVAAYIAGTLTAAGVGFFSVKLMLKLLREQRLWGFALYAGLLGIAVLIDQYGTHVFF